MVTMKGREEYEDLLKDSLDIDWTDKVAFHKNLLAMQRMEIEVLLDLRDFAYSTQAILVQNTNAAVSQNNTLVEVHGLLNIITKVVGQFGVEKGWLKKTDSSDPFKQALAQTSQDGIVDLSVFRK